MVTSELMDAIHDLSSGGTYGCKKNGGSGKSCVMRKAALRIMECHFCMTVEAEEMGAKVDLGTNIYEPHVTDYVIDSVADYHKLTAGGS